MTLIKNIKHSIQLYFLGRELNNVTRLKQVMGFDEATLVGVLFDASNKESFEQSLKFIRELESSGKKVTAMGFINTKKPGSYVIEQIHIGFFKRADFTWNFKLRNTRLQDFVDKQFDILIDLTPSETFHTKLIAGISRTLYKVGVFDNSSVDVFDLMIRLPEPFMLKELMQHAVSYLKMIKKPVSHAG